MKHLENCIEVIQNDELQDAIMLKTFKRKIVESPEAVIESVKKQYKRNFPLTDVKSLVWRKDTLFDNDSQQVRLIFKDKPILIPPVGCTRTVLFKYENEWRLETPLPELSPDALRSIFKFIDGWELIDMRLVSKKWNRIIVNTHSFWNLRISRFPDEWNGLSSFKMYIKHMFLNYKNDQTVINFLLSHEIFFVYMCGLFIGHQNLEVRRMEDGLHVNDYHLTRQNLYCRGNVVRLNTFLDGYRQSIL
jgi:hypothetical protein